MSPPDSPEASIAPVLVVLADLDATTVGMEQPIHAILDAAEIARGERLRIPDRKRLWLRSKAIQRVILGDFLGIDPAALSFTIDPGGKPRIAPTEAVPAPPQFNTSHSGPRLAVAIHPALSVGIDLERADSLRPCADLARRYFHPVERQYVLEAPDPAALAARFHQVWVAKEAIAKCIGSGLGAGPGTGLGDWPAIPPPSGRNLQNGPPPATLWYTAGPVDAPCNVAAIPMDEPKYFCAVAISQTVAESVPHILTRNFTQGPRPQ